MTALGAGLRWVNLLAGMLLVGLFTGSLLAGPRLGATARAWEAGLARWARRLAALALLSGLSPLAQQSAHFAGRAAAARTFEGSGPYSLPTRTSPASCPP